MIGYLQAFSGHIEMEHTNIRTSQHMILTMQVSSLERALIALLKAIAIAHIQAVPRLRRGYGHTAALVGAGKHSNHRSLQCNVAAAIATGGGYRR